SKWFLDLCILHWGYLEGFSLRCHKCSTYKEGEGCISGRGVCTPPPGKPCKLIRTFLGTGKCQLDGSLADIWVLARGTNRHR
uniref:Secreted protein n=1 Tax=Salvator merianae TaxID=96440 RepID=A0A8D0BIL6_SALMN